MDSIEVLWPLNYTQGSIMAPDYDSTLTGVHVCQIQVT